MRPRRPAALLLALIAIGLASAACGPVGANTAPVPADTLLFGGDFQTVFALEARDASTRWSVSLSPAQLSGFPVVQDGTVYASTITGLYALAATDGHMLWRSATAIQVEPGSIANGALYGSTVQTGHDTQLAAIAINDGHLLWQVAAPTLGSASNVSNLAPVDDVVLVGDMLGHVRAFDPASGAQRWQVILQSGPVVALSVGSDGAVYGITQTFGPSQPARAFAIDPRARTLRWQRQLKPSATVVGVLTVADGTLYAGTETGLVALDASSGSERWQAPLANGVGSSQVVVEQGIAYFGNVGGFYALRASDGSVLWKHTDSDTLAFGTPLLSHGVVFTQTTFAGPQNFTQDSGRHVYAFRASDGLQYYRH